MRMILIAGVLLLAVQPTMGPVLAERTQPGTPNTYIERGQASWYGPGFHGEETASGAVFDQTELTAAHPKLPFGTEVIVTNLENGKQVTVEINDRGPYADGRIIDLSREAGRRLDIISGGVAEVRIEATMGPEP
jgi:rare lipoprotein A